MNIAFALRKLFPAVNQGAGPLSGADYKLGWTPHVEGQSRLQIITAWSPQWPLAKDESYPAQPGGEALEAASAPVPPPVPALTARQLRLWLLSMGITPEQVDAQIAAIADAAAQARARVEWEYASEYKHDHPLVVQIGAALGMSQAQIDAGFRAAAAL